jgi:ribosomal protein S18 acetylase RimI-like enzyme
MTMLPLCARIDADDTRSADALKADGWREIEVLQTWRSGVRAWRVNKRPYARRATHDDFNWIATLAADSFEHDRLHADRSVSREDADRAKGRWAGEAMADPDREVWVPVDSPDGFLILRGNVIDLVCVRTAGRRKGVAKRLIRSAIAGKRIALQAGTQSTNIAAQRLYESLGMEIVRRQVTVHK